MAAVFMQEKVTDCAYYYALAARFAFRIHV